MTATAIRLNIKFWHDDCAEDPCNNDGWKVYSFSTRHYNFKDPDDFRDDEAFARKRHEGLAFPLSYYEHGQCLWSLVSELPAAAQCPFDSVVHAGFIVWEQNDDDIGAKTFLDRQADARAFIERYTEWCNGHVFGYTVEAFRSCECCKQDVELDEAGADMDLPSCGGYFDSELSGALIDLRDRVEHDRCEITFEDGHGAYLADEAKRLWKEMGE